MDQTMRRNKCEYNVSLLVSLSQLIDLATTNAWMSRSRLNWVQ